MEPVLVAGAGPVGLATALLLARWRVPSVVLEAAAERSAGGSRAICFQRDVLDIFDRVGCADGMVAEGVTWTTGRTFYREQELFAVEFPDQGAGVLPPWINISQSSVERFLLARAVAEPLIELRFGDPLVDLASYQDRAEAQAGSGTRYRGSHLVGADGSRSTVRECLGVDFPGRSFPDQFLICDIRADLPFPSERRFYFDPRWNPGRQVLVHQCPDGVWRIDWQVPAGFDFAAERASGGLDARVRRITGEIPYQIVWATAYRFHERVAQAFGVGRAFLAGDAAHLYAPFGARGLNSGMADAENLAWKLAFVRHGWAPPDLLDSYHAERSAAAAENLRVTSATMEFLVPRTTESRRWRTDTLDRALTDPDARSLIDSGKLAEPYWYTASPLTTPGPPLDGFPTAPGAIRPAVPGVICPDGPVVADGVATRLRRLFGRSFVVLTQTAPAAAAARRLAVRAVAAPVTAYALDEIDQAGTLRAALAAGPDSVHVVRPDGHFAAVLPRLDRAALEAALRRAAGHPAS
ncbi:MAG TPA: FAD-dependent monooxygenase [Streptosporangiaceae bacterium]|nr:FAD-dependent monooxygenase [Streptosporangiaceae bacterium]